MNTLLEENARVSFEDHVMNYDPVVEEIHEARRKLWAECDGTMEGYSKHCEEVAREFRARVSAELAREQAEGKAESVKSSEAAGAMMVCEQGTGDGAEGGQTTGAGPRTPMGEKADLAREGTEGDAE